MVSMDRRAVSAAQSGLAAMKSNCPMPCSTRNVASLSVTFVTRWRRPGAIGPNASPMVPVVFGIVQADAEAALKDVRGVVGP
jgi:hypothetical protein